MILEKAKTDLLTISDFGPISPPLGGGRIIKRKKEKQKETLKKEH